MATLHRVDTPDSDESLFARLTRLAALELELGWAETQGVLKRLAIALAVAVIAAVALLAASIVLIAGALACRSGRRISRPTRASSCHT